MDLTKTTRTRKALPYKEVKNATRAPVDGGGEVFEGISVKNEDGFLVFEEGRMQQALPLAALSSAIYAGVIPREAIERLWALKAEDDARNAPPVVSDVPAPAPDPVPEPPVVEEPQASAPATTPATGRAKKS